MRLMLPQLEKMQLEERAVGTAYTNLQTKHEKTYRYLPSGPLYLRRLRRGQNVGGLRTTGYHTWQAQDKKRQKQTNQQGEHTA